MQKIKEIMKEEDSDVDSSSWDATMVSLDEHYSSLELGWIRQGSEGAVFGPVPSSEVNEGS